MSARSMWKGYVNFGMISIPVKLYKATSDDKVSFNQLHVGCNHESPSSAYRIRQEKICTGCEKKLESAELAKGFEVESGKYVVMTQDEIAAAEPSSSKVLEIVQFVSANELDPLYFEQGYYLAPEVAGQKAYSLLVKALENKGSVAVGKLTLSQREHVVALRPYQGALVLHKIFYQNEIRSLEDYDITKSAVSDQEISLAEMLIDTMAAPLDMSRFSDSYQDTLKAAIAAKASGVQIPQAQVVIKNETVDLMAALKASLEVRKSA